jgi:hypothetical protein
MNCCRWICWHWKSGHEMVTDHVRSISRVDGPIEQLKFVQIDDAKFGQFVESRRRLVVNLAACRQERHILLGHEDAEASKRRENTERHVAEREAVDAITNLPGELQEGGCLRILLCAKRPGQLHSMHHDDSYVHELAVNVTGDNLGIHSSNIHGGCPQLRRGVADEVGGLLRYG